MEFSILGIRNEASLDEAKRALRQIRINNHPDKNTNATTLQLQSLKHLVTLAEESYQRIEAQQRVTMAIDSVMTGNSRMNNYYKQNHNGDFLSNLFTNMDLSTGTHQHSSYTYQNNNGNIQEFGTINGRSMTQDEINNYRS
jgi:DnaJ-class molecular chaperone